MPAQVVALVSGGLDSTVMMYWLASKGIDFLPLFIDYGQHCAQTELQTLHLVIPSGIGNSISIIDIRCVYAGSRSRLIVAPDLWTENITADDLHLPYRNSLLLTTAAAFAESHGLEAVYSAFINGSCAREDDCTLAFFNEIGKLVERYGGVKIMTPFGAMSKSDVVRMGVDLGVPIDRTFSCQANPTTPCGACPNCVDRLEALETIKEWRR